MTDLAIIARHLSPWHVALFLRVGSKRALAVIFDGAHGTGGGGLQTLTERDGIRWHTGESSGVVPWSAVTGLLDRAPVGPVAALQSAVATAGWREQARAKAALFAALTDEPVGQLDLFEVAA